MDTSANLINLEKLLMSTQKHYQYPHREAMMFKRLWSYDKTLNKEREIDMCKSLLKEATELVKEPSKPPEEALAIITKGLHMDPRSHELYALRGEISAKEGDWQRAIKCYETARKMLKFDKTSNGETIADKYNEKLRNVYRGRGEWNVKNERLIEAIADYEQVLVLHPRRHEVFELEDLVLKYLRKLDNYEAYRSAWTEFMKEANPQRTADLMTKHAEFKIHIREISAARRMLREAISLDKKNVDAQDLLQVIFDTGHIMLVYAVIWCINGCYDKALMTIDKGTDCDPYNPGFTVLKTIVLRLSGRLKEAMKWLDSVNNAFYKLLEPSSNKRGSIMGNLTVDQTKAMLIDQWYMIRYDMAVKDMVNGRYEAALKILQDENLLNKFLESRLLMGDCFMHQGKLALALKSYLKAHEESIHSKGCWERTEKSRLITQRVTEILNSNSRRAIQANEIEKCLRNSEDALGVFNRQKVPLKQLGSLRSEALMYNARSHHQKSNIKATYPCLRALADSLSFARGVDDGGIRNTVFGNKADLAKKISCFGSKKEFPYCTKILMQN